MTMLTDAQTDDLLNAIDHLHARWHSTPRWRLFERVRRENAWLEACAQLQESEAAKSRVRIAARRGEGTLLERAAGLLVRNEGGSIGIRYEPGDGEDMRWSVMGVFGREAEEDSNMAGGAIHGVAGTIDEALDQALREARC